MAEKDQIDKIREEMFAKFADYEKQKENEILKKRRMCFHKFTSFSRVSSEGHQLIVCGKCGYQTIRQYKY